MKRELYNGIDVDIWAPIQTINPRKRKFEFPWYMGYDDLKIEWWDLVEEIPLEIRKKSFDRRLQAALDRNEK